MFTWDSAKRQLKAAGPWGVTGAFIGSTGFVLVEYLDGSRLDVTTVLLGAGVGALVGTGMGMLINAARDQRIENYTVVAPVIATGVTMGALKAYPRTRGMSNKSLISAGLVGGTVGLTLGGSIDYLT